MTHTLINNEDINILRKLVAEEYGNDIFQELTDDEVREFGEFLLACAGISLDTDTPEPQRKRDWVTPPVVAMEKPALKRKQAFVFPEETLRLLGYCIHTPEMKNRRIMEHFLQYYYEE